MTETAPPLPVIHDVTISVVVCAYTDARYELLEMCIESVLEQLSTADELIVVIDYNDALFDRVARAYRSRAVVVRNTNARGLCGARNAGIEAARQSVVAFVDDDAHVEPGWLHRLQGHYHDPSVTGVGGYAQPVWPIARPSWLPREFDWVVGCSHRGLPEDVSPVRNLLGCNMSFRRTALNEAGGFSSKIGQVGANLVRCDETELCIRLQQALPASRVLLDPSISVRHWVSDDRTRFAYFVKRCFYEGLSKHRLTTMVGSRDGLSAERHYVVKVLPTALARGLMSAAGRHGQRGGNFARSAALIAGLTVTAAGYVYSLMYSLLRR